MQTQRWQQGVADTQRVGQHGCLHQAVMFPENAGENSTARLAVTLAPLVLDR